MKCAWYYEWVKLPRNILPEGRGILGAWMKLASRAAFRKGRVLYCGYTNTVVPGMWAGGVVGLKSILKTKSRKKALDTLENLKQLGYIRYEMDEETKKLSYQITDWVKKCSGAPCMKGTAYATEGYGFFCIPRGITERLTDQNYIFDEADAWLDLWCHTVTEDSRNAFSFLAPAVQYGKYGAILTLETLGQRWGWEKTKVWRFFQKHGDVFALYRLPGSYGCLVFNKQYPMGTEVSLPLQEDILEILEKIRTLSSDVIKKGSEHEHMSRMVAWYSKRLIEHQTEVSEEKMENSKITDNSEHPAENDDSIWKKSRVALSAPIIYAYLSQCRNCENCKYDCKGKDNRDLAREEQIRGPCVPVDLTKLGKEIVLL